MMDVDLEKILREMHEASNATARAAEAILASAQAQARSAEQIDRASTRHEIAAAVQTVGNVVVMVGVLIMFWHISEALDCGIVSSPFIGRLMP